MSQENVALARRVIGALNANDWNTLRDVTHPDLTVAMADGFIDVGPFIGREAFMRWREETWAVFPDAVVEPVGDLTAIRDHVVMSVRAHGSGHGPEVTFEYSVVSTWLDGKAVSLEFFWDREEALKAVGLEA